MKNFLIASSLFLLLLGLVSSTFAAKPFISKLQPGDPAPKIVGKDQFGRYIDSDKILQTDQIVLVFYRGVWCPHCMKQLRTLQASLNNIEAKGAKVIVVTPEQPPFIEATMKKTGASFSIISDSSYGIMDAFGVSFQLNESSTSNYVLSNTRKGNGNKDDILPVPATYIIGKDGKIRYMHFDENYRNRAPISDILDSLEEL